MHLYCSRKRRDAFSSVEVRRQTEGKEKRPPLIQESLRWHVCSFSGPWESFIETRTLQEPPLAMSANTAEVAFLNASLPNDWSRGQYWYKRFPALLFNICFYG